MSCTSQPLPPILGGLVLGKDWSPFGAFESDTVYFCCPVLQLCLCHAVELLPDSLCFPPACPSSPERALLLCCCFWTLPHR